VSVEEDLVEARSADEGDTGDGTGATRATPRGARPLEEWDPRPRILVTNDDGIESRGLLALKRALEPIGDVYVAAPETNQSAVGHQKTFMRPLRVRERSLADGSRGWSVDGSPTDAVSLAFLGYFDVGFDLVASGINYGANLGDDITYSGTVSAAMEAVIFGCPAFAVSQEFYEHPDFGLAERMAHLVALNILEHGLGPGELLNVNVPAISADELEGIEVTRMGKRIYQDELVRRLDPRGIPYFWFGGQAPSGHAEPGTDFHAVVNRRVAITPIQLDLTAQRLLERIRGWDWSLSPAASPDGAGSGGPPAP
jgi:5'-nucleotidase